MTFGPRRPISGGPEPAARPAVGEAAVVTVVVAVEPAVLAVAAVAKW